MNFCFSAPFLTAKPDKSEFTAGERAQLNCSYVSPNDVVAYRFFFNDEVLLNSTLSQIHFNHLKPQDSGSYTCNLDAIRISGTTPKSNVVSITVGKLTKLISF